LAADYLTAARIHQYVQHMKAEEDYKEPEELLKSRSTLLPRKLVKNQHLHGGCRLRSNVEIVL
jgi:hypothetical protein